jgi:hypothetical protein
MLAANARAADSTSEDQIGLIRVFAKKGSWLDSNTMVLLLNTCWLTQTRPCTCLTASLSNKALH